MQHFSESSESPAPPPNTPFNIDDTPFIPFEEFKTQVDSLVADMLQHPQRDQLLSDFCQILREIGIPIEDPVDAHDSYTDVGLETSSQAGTVAIDSESGQMVMSSSTHAVHEEPPRKAFEDPAACDSISAEDISRL